MNYFVWPFVVFLLPLPVLIFFLSKYLSTERSGIVRDALRIPFFDRVVSFAGGNPNARMTGRLILLTLAWIALIIAGMRPVYYEDEIRSPQEARNIMLAIDLSASMAERDLVSGPYRISRIAVVKDVVQDFISNRQGDRLGLIIFGSSAHTLAPLSSDLNTLKTLFDDVDLGIAGEQTAIGDALALAVQDTAKIPIGKKAIILLSDGYSNADSITIPEAIELAQKQKIPVYTIGIGPQQHRGSFFDRGAAWDEKTLKRIATETGGQYFVAHSAQELAQVYEKIDQLETLEFDGIVRRPRRDIFYYPLGLALLFWLLSMRRRLK